MIPKDLIKRIKAIELQTSRFVSSVFSGEYHSVFKGKGMEFSEVREYQEGDDVRSIDWNVTARAGRPFIKIFTEERELTVMLMVDLSSSGEFGTTGKIKREQAVEISATLAFSAISNNDKVGMLLFSDKLEKYIAPQKGRRHVLRVIRELLYFKPENRGTRIKNSLDYLNKVLKKRCILFIISDFKDRNYEKSLQIASKKHDLAAITISDPREFDIPRIGLVEFEDAETGEIITVDTDDDNTRNYFFEQNNKQLAYRDRLFKKLKIDSIDMDTSKDFMIPLMIFFKKRAKKLQWG